MEIRRLVALEIALHLCWVVLEGCERCWLSSFIFSCSYKIVSQSRVIYSYSESDCTYCSFICFHLIEHLEELVFALLRWFDNGGHLLKRGEASVLDMMLIVGWWRDRAPNSYDGFAFGCRVANDSLLRGHYQFGRCFWGRFWESKGREILSIGTQVSMKSTNLWQRYSDMIDRAVNFAPQGLGISQLSGDNRDLHTENMQGHQIFP